jgi:hypothetical protein
LVSNISAFEIHQFVFALIKSSDQVAIDIFSADGIGERGIENKREGKVKEKENTKERTQNPHTKWQMLRER